MKLNKLSLVLSLSVVTSLVSYPLQALEKDKEINWVTTYGSSGSSTIAGSYDSINDIENLVDNKEYLSEMSGKIIEFTDLIEENQKKNV